MKYTTSSFQNFDSNSTLLLLPKFWKDELSHLNSIHNKNVWQLRFWGMCLAKKLISDHLGIPFEETHLYYNCYGKPFLAIDNLFVSISHTIGLVACVLNDTEVGIDVENMNSFPHQMPNFVFSEREWEYVNSASCQAEFTYRCCRLWTFKEAYFKAYGSGISNYNCVSIFDYEHLCHQKVISNCFITIFKTA